MSSHSCPVIIINRIKPHPNPESTMLELITIYAYPCLVAKGQFKVGDLAAFIIPDSLVKTCIPEFEFLKERNGKKYEIYRVKGIKLKGCNSQGLLIPARSHWKLGDDVSAELQIEHYEPDIMGSNNPVTPKLGGTCAAKPPRINGIIVPEYTDIENYRKYYTAFDDFKEDVVVTEKLHGANARFTFTNGKLYVGSHHMWKLGESKANGYFKHILAFIKDKPILKKYFVKLFGTKVIAYNSKPLDAYWAIAKKHKLEEQFTQNQFWRGISITLFGEIYGAVQKGFQYDATIEEPLKLRIFDAMKEGEYLNWKEVKHFAEKLGIPTVPELYIGPWDKEKIIAMAEMDNTLGTTINNISEGVVVKAAVEQIHPKLGRLILKIVSNRYLQIGEGRKDKKKKNIGIKEVSE